MLVITRVTAGREASDGDQQTLTVAAGPARDFYLAASHSYQVVSQQVGETTINSYAPAQPAARRAAGSRDGRAGAAQAFEERFGPYPYSELDLVSTATSALGVEYPGIIALTDRIYRRPVSSAIWRAPPRTRSATSGSTTWWATTRWTSRGWTRR